jgi:hypothetical protein
VLIIGEGRPQNGPISATEGKKRRKRGRKKGENLRYLIRMV